MIFCGVEMEPMPLVVCTEVSSCGKLMDIEVSEEQLRTKTWGRESTV